MGRRFPPGEEGGVAVLHFLANHPSTHRFLATKLARHFVADDPPPDAVRHVEAALRDTGGNLGAAAASLITLDAAWQPGAKLRDPQDYVDRLPARARPAAGATSQHEPAGHARRPRPAVLERAAAEWLGRPGQRLGRAGGDDAPHRLGLWRCRPRGRPAKRPRRRRPGRGQRSARCSPPTRCRRCAAPAPAATR